MSKYPHLFSPLKIGNITVKNRIELSPTAIPNYRPGGYVNWENWLSYDQKAKSGAGLIVHDEMIVHYTSGGREGADFDRPARTMLDMRRESDAVHRYGGISSLSLNHYGGWVNMDYAVDGGKIYGPSQIINPYGLLTAELSEEMLTDIAESYGRAASLSRLAGHDMCQIHSSHGWLLSQFLSPAQNQRTDKFGGSLENRARFPLMVVEAIRKWAPDFPIEYRLSVEEYLPNGFHFDEAQRFIQMLGEKIDLLHLSTSTFWDPSCGKLFPGMFDPHSLNISYAAAIKKVTPVPVAVVGAHSDLAQMDEYIASGQADILAVGRGFIADPYWAYKAFTQQEQDITPCVRCNYCVPGAYEPARYTMFHVHTCSCTVNPAFGREYYPLSLPPTTAKKVLIIGGGPGGLQAAVTACDRGHQVILCEQQHQLGGLLHEIIGPSFKEDYRRYLNVMLKRINERPIEVRLNTHVTPELARSLKVDIIIAAIGGAPLIPDIPGADLPGNLYAGNIRQAQIGQRVVIVGGGSLGAEEALALTEEGRQVTVIEQRDKIGLGAPYVHFCDLQKQMAKHDAPQCIVKARCTRITEEGVYYCREGEKEQFLPADTVLLATGMTDCRQQAEAFRGSAPEFRLLGDCRQPATIAEAVRDGFEIAYGI